MNIAFDVDGVLANFNEGWWKILQHIRRVRPRPIPSTWNWPLLAGYTPEEIEQSWRMIETSCMFWLELKPLPDCTYLSHIYKKLTRRHAVYFVTTRQQGQLVKQQTERWLHDQLHAFPTVLVAKEKGHLAASLGIDVFVDDAADNALDINTCSPSTHVFLIDKPYNRATCFSKQSLTTRVSNLRVVIQELVIRECLKGTRA